MRTAHYTAFEAAVKTRVSALASKVHDGDVPLNTDGTVKRETYLVLHDMGFDIQDDDRLTVTVQDTADGRYRVIVRVVATTRTAVRATADVVKSALTSSPIILTVPGRICGAIQTDPGPLPVERDDDVSPPIFYLDMDFTFRSQRA